MDLVLENVEDSMPIVLHPPAMSDDEYYEFCQRYDRFRVERMSDGSVVIMPPTGLETAFRNSEITEQLTAWAKRDSRGVAFDSNAEFILADGSALSPDASWVHRDRIGELSRKQKQRFPALCPDFVIEIRSPSNRLRQMDSKMKQWIENGVQLAWLIDPDRRTVTTYRPGIEPEVLTGADQIEAGGPVSGFVLDLKSIWAGL